MKPGRQKLPVRRITWRTDERHGKQPPTRQEELRNSVEQETRVEGHSTGERPTAWKMQLKLKPFVCSRTRPSTNRTALKVECDVKLVSSLSSKTRVYQLLNLSVMISTSNKFITFFFFNWKLPQIFISVSTSMVKFCEHGRFQFVWI